MKNTWLQQWVPIHKLSTFCGRLSYFATELPPGPKLRPPQSRCMELRSGAVWVTHWEPVFLWGEPMGASPRDTELTIWHTVFTTFQWNKLFKHWGPLNPNSRETLKEIMTDPWLNMGQEEGLKPYSEQLCESMAPRVTEVLRSMRF